MLWNNKRITRVCKGEGPSNWWAELKRGELARLGLSSLSPVREKLPYNPRHETRAGCDNATPLISIHTATILRDYTFNTR